MVKKVKVADPEADNEAAVILGGIQQYINNITPVRNQLVNNFNTRKGVEKEKKKSSKRAGVIMDGDEFSRQVVKVTEALLQYNSLSKILTPGSKDKLEYTNSRGQRVSATRKDLSMFLKQIVHDIKTFKKTFKASVGHRKTKEALPGEPAHERSLIPKVAQDSLVGFFRD